VDLENLLDLRLPALRRASHDPQVLRRLDLAVAVGVAKEDEDLARLRCLQQHVAHGLAGGEGQVTVVTNLLRRNQGLPARITSAGVRVCHLLFFAEVPSWFRVFIYGKFSRPYPSKQLCSLWSARC
jgi:hypothetical protein